MAVATNKAAGKTAAKPARRRTTKPKGMYIARTFTTEGVHPYDAVDWELRDVVQTNWKTGETVFEQKDVEFPSFWSVNASTIATTKYFRGALGTEARERSLKQLIDRVVLTYTAEGKDKGYFATDTDAEIFEHELTYVLLHQYFAFNSPVWFNVGTASVPQVSACQPYDALVTTVDGLRQIGELHNENAIGTVVRTHDGDALVLATKHNGRKEVLRLTTASGHEVDVTADHLVWAVGKGFVPAGSLVVGDQLTWHRQEAKVPAVVGTRQTLSQQASEAAFAGWLATDGFVGQYDHGTNRSLTVEPHTVNDQEYAWVGGAIEAVFPDAHFNESTSSTRDPAVDFRRRRAYGEQFRPFVETWGLLSRGVTAAVPGQLFTADLDVVAAWLRSVFQADGYVSLRENAAQIGLSTEAEGFIKGTQALLSRFGIFSRVSSSEDNRGDRNTRWSLSIMNLGDRELFAEHIGFVGEDKQSKLLSSLGLPGMRANLVKKTQIKSITSRGVMDVYDIQTTAGEYLTAGGIRVHNCFILGVEDSMESILNWYTEEGFIFKGGSGAGVNLSNIRSSKELLSSGGTASGPVSFMRGADASAGTIKSGGATRRAAKMVVLDVDHPDIEEFVETKAREEDKIRALRDAGFDMDLGGKDIVSVQYQNANNSVRVDDKFMKAVENGGTYDLLARKDGSVIETVDARELFGKIAKAAWECADPGIQYKDTINDWHTLSALSPITASNPCSEFLSIDNSSCNLASINLMKFLNDDGSFDVDNFVALVQLGIVAMDISVAFGHFPTEKIGENTRRYRQLGIGYANLGALLMASGLGYDSEGGRDLAAAITSLMSAAAHVQSARLAKTVGAYHDWDVHAPAHTRVVKMHRDAAVNVAPLTGPEQQTANDISSKAFNLWTTALAMTEQDGLRNSQLSLLAPTGTIGFLMDCDTTGIEPDFSLVKFKKLVGGGSMKIVNNTVSLALGNLGYDEATAQAIVAHISEHGHVVGAPGLKTEHYEIFDCAVGKDRFIAPMGHVEMMAAVQPFLSGAISKTVNLPEEATVEEIADVYMKGWKLGLKALAIYRDNCKVGQPLSSGDSAKKGEPKAQTVVIQTVEKEKVVYRPKRTRLPRTRDSKTTSFSVGGAEGYLTAGSYDDGQLGELFLKFGKQGSTLAGVMDAFSIAISVALQYGVPLETFVAKFTNQKFEPAGMTDDPDIRMASSLMDYVFRRLALDYMPFEERDALGVHTAEERKRYVETGSYELTEEEDAALHEDDLVGTTRSTEDDGDEDIPSVRFDSRSVSVAEKPAPQAPAEVHSSAELADRLIGKTSDAPLCMTCGTKMQRAGSCYVCEGCGNTSGCS